MFLQKIVNSKLGGMLLGYCFARFSFILPVRRVFENDRLLAFHHPKPCYPLHILLVPKEAVCTLADLPTSEMGLLHEILETAQKIVDQLDLPNSGTRIILNAGDYQKVPQLHFHLIADQ
jgi:histidine triad (HIT) family protein